MSRSARISVVVPLFNEKANVEPLAKEVRRALSEGPDWELILVDDGSTDGTASQARGVIAGDERIRLIQLATNYGQTTAMQAGFDHATGEVVVSMDGDLQNDPADIPRLVSKIGEGFDLVAGYRDGRWADRLLSRRVPSVVANFLIRSITGVPIRDNGCSLKAYRAELLPRMHLYSDMHRFIPAVAAATSGAKIAEIPVRYRPRVHGASKYGFSRTWRVLADLLVVAMIRSFREQPLALFGLGAGAAACAGLGFAAAMVVAAVSFGPSKAYSVVFPGATLLCFGLAAYLLMLGLIAEVAIRRSTGAWEIGEGPLLREEMP